MVDIVKCNGEALCVGVRWLEEDGYCVGQVDLDSYLVNFAHSFN